MQSLRGLQRSAVQALGASHVEICLIDRSHLDQRREVPKHFMNRGGILAIAFGASIDKNRLRAKLCRSSKRHRRVDPKLARRVRCRRDYTSFIALPADNYGLALQ